MRYLPSTIVNAVICNYQLCLLFTLPLGSIFSSVEDTAIAEAVATEDTEKSRHYHDERDYSGQLPPIIVNVPDGLKG